MWALQETRVVDNDQICQGQFKSLRVQQTLTFHYFWPLFQDEDKDGGQG